MVDARCRNGTPVTVGCVVYVYSKHILDTQIGVVEHVTDDKRAQGRIVLGAYGVGKGERFDVLASETIVATERPSLVNVDERAYAQIREQYPQHVIFFSRNPWYRPGTFYAVGRDADVCVKRLHGETKDFYWYGLRPSVQSFVYKMADTAAMKRTAQHLGCSVLIVQLPTGGDRPKSELKILLEQMSDDTRYAYQTSSERDSATYNAVQLQTDIETPKTTQIASSVQRRKSPEKHIEWHVGDQVITRAGHAGEVVKAEANERIVRVKTVNGTREHYAHMLKPVQVSDPQPTKPKQVIPNGTRVHHPTLPKLRGVVIDFKPEGWEHGSYLVNYGDGRRFWWPLGGCIETKEEAPASTALCVVTAPVTRIEAIYTYRLDEHETTVLNQMYDHVGTWRPTSADTHFAIDCLVDRGLAQRDAPSTRYTITPAGCKALNKPTVIPEKPMETLVLHQSEDMTLVQLPLF